MIMLEAGRDHSRQSLAHAQPPIRHTFDLDRAFEAYSLSFGLSFFALSLLHASHSTDNMIRKVNHLIFLPFCITRAVKSGLSQII